MFKKNPNRPPITINLRKVNNGYKVIANDSFNPFSFKKITRAIFKNDLQNSKGTDTLNAGGMLNSSFSSPAQHITLPLSAKWFDFDQIHDVQRESFPQFFLQEDEQGKLFIKSPKLYKFYRNFIITLWRENSKKYLSASICRKNLPGDVSAILRIHAFLQHWGLINFPSREHSKGYIQQKSQQYFCHVCQVVNANQYYVCRLDEEATFQICGCCYAGQIYPSILERQSFGKVIPKVHEDLKRKKMTNQQIQKLMQIVGVENTREKQMWTSISQTFPNFTKQQIILNFLLIPENHKMNANIFWNNEDVMQQQQPQSGQDPTIYENFQDQEQLSISSSYYLWKTQPQKYPELSKVFQCAQLHAKYLASIQNEKSGELIRMLIDFQQSKLELKSIFIQELQKLADSEAMSLQTYATNLMAEQLKNHEMQEQ